MTCSTLTWIETLISLCLLEPKAVLALVCTNNNEVLRNGRLLSEAISEMQKVGEDISINYNFAASRITFSNGSVIRLINAKTDLMRVYGLALREYIIDTFDPLDPALLNELQVSKERWRYEGGARQRNRD